MSINVTVNGNPVNIKRGKMVTADPYNVKQEFDKKRLMRIEQVRKQSKDLAENIRNKVKKEKQKQVGELEKAGKEKYAKWQNQKLLELEEQYKQALDDIGLGHDAANKFENNSELLDKKQQQNAKIAKLRGKIAATKLELQKVNEKQRKNLPWNQKRLSRDIENTRAAFISSKKKLKSPQKINKKKASANVNVTVSNDSETEEEEDGEEVENNNTLSNISEEGSNETDNSGNEDKSQASINSPSDKNHNIAPENRQYVSDSLNNPDASHSSMNHHSKRSPNELEFKENSYQKSISDRKKLIENFQQNDIPMETRISDRIKLRKIMAEEPDFCDNETSVKNTNELYEYKKDDINSCPCKSHSAVINPSHRYYQHLENQTTEFNYVDKNDHLPSRTTILSEDIPSRPGIKLKESAPSKTTEMHSKSQILSDASKVMPNDTSELEWFELMKRRDREAELRGKRALEKEKIKHDYEELKKKLPILQRLGNLSQIEIDKSDEPRRSNELERQKQNRLQNAYFKTGSNIKPETVTIPSRKPKVYSSEDICDPCYVLNRKNTKVLNLDKLDPDTRQKKMFSAEEVQEIIESFTYRKPEDRRAKLKQLLRDLKLQKEQLLEEIKNLPNNDSINALIDDLNSFTDVDVRDVKKVSHKTHMKKKKTTDSASSSSETESVKKSSSNGHKKTPVTKSRTARQVLILQNTSTQTSPRPPIGEKRQQSPAQLENLEKRAEISTVKSLNQCKKTHVMCDCNKENSQESVEELCRIFIKLQGEETPKVQVVKKSKNISEEADPCKENGELTVPSKGQKKIDSEAKITIEQPKKKQTKSVATETTPTIDGIKHLQAQSKSDSNTTAQSRNIHHSAAHRPSTWKDHLSKSSISSISSTSYFSPPEFSIASGLQGKKLLLNSLPSKPQQTNTSGPSISKKRSRDDSRISTDSAILQNYVRKLLSMSKASVEELQVSSSDVLTPSQSVIDIESNNPLAALHDLIKFVNSKAAGIERDIIQKSCDPASVSSKIPATQSNVQIESKKDGSKVTDSKRQQTASNLSHYADVADSCNKRIANISAMIEKIRKEKVEMIEKPVLQNDEQHDALTPTSTVENNHSTKYLELPQNSSAKESNTTPSSEEEEFYKKLLEIDMSLAEKLKNLPKEDSVAESADVLDEADQDFLLRFQKLIAADYENDRIAEKKTTTSEMKESDKFVPVLLDIPKLPILEPMPETQLSETGKRHPPPSKGLISAKKFNGNISLVPHELSTIAEADSQLSTKISPNTSKKVITLTEDVALKLDEPTADIMKSIDNNEKLATVEPEKRTLNDQSRTPKGFCSLEVSSVTSPKKQSIDKSSPSIDSISDSSKKSSSSSSSNDMASIEAMLRSIGMDWAIPTLHKTQNALALSSSSNSAKNHTSSSNSSSELNLKSFLKKQLLNKISSSSLSSEASPGSFLQQSTEISGIAQNSFQSDKTKKRTSTPLSKSQKVISNKWTRDDQLFSESSDISSVKEVSQHSKNSRKKLENEKEFHSLNSDDDSKRSV